MEMSGTQHVDQRVREAQYALQKKSDNVEKYKWLVNLSAADCHVFYKLLVQNLSELLPVVYTPTIGDGCLRFGRLFSCPPGRYISAFEPRSYLSAALDSWPSDVELVVVTDGGRILGLGDLGTNGLGISIGKASLHVAAAGFQPSRVIPTCLDCGTDNQKLREDLFYSGNRAARIRGRDHLKFVQDFCRAVHARWPSCVIHFEDFQTEDAFRVLDALRYEMPCYNDDIQGTAAVTVAGIMNGMKIQKTAYKDLKVLFFGAGSSACGVAHMLASLIEKKSELTIQEGYSGIYMMDIDGLLTNTRGDTLPSYNACFARRDGTPDMKTLLEIVKYVQPHALIGLSGAGPSFSKNVVQEMCRHCERPLIFPLSNPTSKAEITAEQAYHWSGGKCLFAAGSPFAPVRLNGRTYVNGQANNLFIFPGIAFGSVAVKAGVVTDDMFMTAARTLADMVDEVDVKKGRMYPDVKNLREISLKIAAAVAETAVEQGVAGVPHLISDFSDYIQGRTWTFLDE